MSNCPKGLSRPAFTPRWDDATRCRPRAAQKSEAAFVASSNHEHIDPELRETAGVPLRRRGASQRLCGALQRKRLRSVSEEL
jgi:hypothetical protein